MCISVAPVKALQRSQTKVREYAAEAAAVKGDGDAPPWPHVKQLGDVLRAMVVCGSAEQLIQTWRAIESVDGFGVAPGHGRVKSNFGPKNTEKPPDMCVCCSC